MSKENNKRRIREITAFAAALIMVGAFSLPSGTEIMGVGLGSAVVASAAEVASGTCGTSVNWSLDNAGKLTISGTGAMNDWNFRSTAPWYDYKNTIKSVVIENGVTSIGKMAFYRCTSLEKITIPDSVITIGNLAFMGCTGIEGINIPKSVTSIGVQAFSGCTNLKGIEVDSNNLVYSSEGGVLFNKSKTALIAYPNAKGDSYIIPDGVTSIDPAAFSECTSLKSVTIPSSVESIGDFAFSLCSSLESVFIPEGLSNIGTDAIPTSVTQIKYTVDSNDKVTVTEVILSDYWNSVTIPDTIDGKTVKAVYIKDGTTGVNVPESVTKVSYSVDANGNVTITRVTLGSSQTSFAIPEKIGGKAVTAIGVNTFNGCLSLESITIPNSVTSIDYSAFYGCNGLSNINVDNNNQNYSSIEGVLFNKEHTELIIYPLGKSEDHYVIPNGVTSIGNIAFKWCSNLANITIPDSVTSIGEYAFAGCTSLSSITIPKGVTSIKSCAFYGCTGLTSITIPDSVTSIGVSAFVGCESLATINIPNSVNSIEDYAFCNCTSLESIDIPNSVTSISGYTFAGCEGLKSITIPNSVESIGEYAFAECTSLESILLPDDIDVSAADIPETAVQIKYTVDTVGNVQITKVTLGSGKTTFDIPKAIDGKTVTAVTNNAFAGCTNLESIFISEDIDVSNAGIPKAAAQVSYIVDTKGNVTITKVDISDQTSVDIPDTIDGELVTDIADGVLENCPDVEHTHREKTAATCTEKPVCSICGQGYDEALGHDHSGDWQKNDTKHWKVCTRNDCVEILDKANHDYDNGEITTPATEDAEGVKTFTCKTCGYEKTEPIAKLNHTHKTAEEYSKDESGHWHTCSGCEEKVDFAEHSFGEGVVTTEPTADAEGVMTYTCEICGYEKTEAIPVTEPSIPETPEEKVNSFVERLYENVLGRPSDPSKESHIDNLNNGETATKVAYDFVFSPEFTELDISNEERVTIMYNTFLNRDPDPAGLETWTKALDNGCSIGHIFYGFTQSGEFGEICEEYGIEQGTWEYTENRDKSAELTSFVSRLYTKAMGRKFDVNGLNDHTGTYLENHDLYQLAYDFIFSPEFLEKNLSDEDFVDTMYRTFFDREADPDGRADWLGRLKSGCSREEVLAGFVGSQECINLVARFGI